MKFYKYVCNGLTFTRPFITPKIASRYTRFLINFFKADCVYWPLGKEDSKNTVHYMIDCPQCSGKGKTGNPQYGEESLKVCTKCEGKKKLMASKL